MNDYDDVAQVVGVVAVGVMIALLFCVIIYYSIRAMIQVALDAYDWLKFKGKK